MWGWDDTDLGLLSLLWMQALAEACAAGPAQFTSHLPVRDLRVGQGLVSGRVGEAYGADLVVVGCATLAPHFWEPRLAQVRRQLEGLPPDLPRAAVWSAAAMRLEASGLLAIQDLRVSCTCAQRRLPCAHVSSLGHAVAALVEVRPSELLHLLGVDPPAAEFLNGYLGEGVTSGPVRPEMATGTFWAGKPRPAAAVLPVAEAPVPRRDLPLRIQNPPFWPTPDFAGPMAALCQALAAWTPCPAPDPASFQVGFTAEELASLRLAAGGALRPARSAPRDQVIPLHPAAVRQADSACPQCGAPVREKWRYCGQCGAKTRRG